MTDIEPFDRLFPDRAWTVCFYSYRGGVGRTTLTVNVARDFSSFVDIESRFREQKEQNERCLLIDFDLEAPGVDEFECMRPPDSKQPGLVEYIAHYLRTGEDPPLAEFTYAPRGKHGPVVMRAGRRDRGYQRFLGAMNWTHFYKHCDGAAFLDNLRIAAAAELGCRTVFVDSRTGHSEIAGVCTAHLADALVLVFQPSTAHADGLVQVVNALRERERREERFIPRFYVANKVPEIYDAEIPEELRDWAERLVMQCEGSGLAAKNGSIESHGAALPKKYLENFDQKLDWSECQWPDMPQGERIVHLTYLPLQARVRESQQPDRFLREQWPYYPHPWVGDLLAWSFDARRFVAEDQYLRSIPFPPDWSRG